MPGIQAESQDIVYSSESVEMPGDLLCVIAFWLYQSIIIRLPSTMTQYTYITTDCPVSFRDWSPSLLRCISSWFIDYCFFVVTVVLRDMRDISSGRNGKVIRFMYNCDAGFCYNSFLSLSLWSRGSRGEMIGSF